MSKGKRGFMKNKELISKLTLEEKCAFFTGKDFWQTLGSEQHGIPGIFLADGPTGVRKQKAAADHLGLNPSYEATCFPTAATMANSWDVELCQEMGTALGEEARDLAVNVLLGPGMNIKRNPLCGRNFEYYSEDPYLTGKVASATVKGIQSNGIAACVKHFAVNSQEERRMVVDEVVDERALREIFLQGFEMAMKDAKPKTIMSAYNQVNGEFANESQHLLVDILRKEWGFDGVVVTDWGGCNDRVEGLKAGNELEMPGGHKDTIKEIVQAVKDGKISEELVDENLDRFLSLVFDVYGATGEIKEITHKNHEVAKHCSEKSIVLLRNENKALPLSKEEKVAVIGNFAKKARYQGAGSSVVNPTKLDNVLDRIGSSDINVIGFEEGFHRFGKKKNGLIKKAVKLAKQSDTVLLFLGLDELSEAEGLDRPSMRLPAPQYALVNALTGLGKKIVVVLSCGSAVELDFAENVDAIVHGYLAGQAGAGSVIKVLTGEVNPSGKLSESYPFKYEDCSTSKYFPGHHATSEHRESLFVGYRYYDTAGVEVRYPFGFGLSYTNFEYSDYNVTDKGVSFSVANTGEVDGEEVCQMYVSLENSNIIRAKQELKGFKKVFIKAGESVKVEIEFDEYTFRFFNTLTNAWDKEQGTYTINVGSSSRDHKLTNTLEVAGTVMSSELKDALPSYASGNVKDVPDSEFATMLGRDIPDWDIPRILKKNGKKKKKIIVGYNTTVLELKYAKGWTGRMFAWGVRLGYRLCKAFGKTNTANMLAMFTFHLPMRGLQRMTGGAMSWGQLDGLLMMFNGKFWRGLSAFNKAGKIVKKEKKAEKKAEKLALKEASKTK